MNNTASDLAPGAALADWLERLEALRPEHIELGLGRIGTVLENLDLDLSHSKIITVAGTNGKGSVVAYLEAIYRQQNISTLAYTSPHILKYNERVRINGRDAGDAELVAAFERVEAARGGVPLTYFEFGTLAALVLLAEYQPHVAILEIGLGGRLDAVNVVDADIAVITSIGIDHTDWLGPDRASIAREKAGIMRAGKPVISGDPEPPPAIAASADACGAPLYQYGPDYRIDDDFNFLCSRQDALSIKGLESLPEHQRRNAATALAAASLLSGLTHIPDQDTHNSGEVASQDTHNFHRDSFLKLDARTLTAGEWLVSVPGRMQLLSRQPDVWLDVGHNPQAAEALADSLRHAPVNGRSVAVLAMLADKDATGVAAALDAIIEHWYLAPTAGPRGLSVTDLQQLVAKGAHAPVTTLQSVPQALEQARADADPEDRIIVLGSFMNATALLGKSVEQA